VLWPKFRLSGALFLQWHICNDVLFLSRKNAGFGDGPIGYLNPTGCQTGLYNRFDNGIDNRLYCVYKHLPGCQTGLTTGLTKPVWQQVVSCKRGLSTVKWAQWDKTQSTELLCLFICVCISLRTIVAHNIAQNRPDNFPPCPSDNYHCSDDVYLREGWIGRKHHVLHWRSRSSMGRGNSGG